MPFFLISNVFSALPYRATLARTIRAGAILAGSMLVWPGPASAEQPPASPRPAPATTPATDVAPSSPQTMRPGLRYTHETAKLPRPLEIHVFEVDLDADGLSIEALVPPDPDTDGPAESSLLKPEKLAAQPDVVAAVNANAFAAIPDAAGKTPDEWRVDMPVTICGWARTGGVDRSPAENGYAMFWIDAAGRAHIGGSPGDATQKVRAAAAGFGLLLSAGKVVAPVDTVLHPRTAAGTNPSGKRVWLVVVDGRQPSFSEGMTCHELAALMQRLGCSDAVNLDGGGSSVLMKAAPSGALEITNRPSGKVTRPVPVMLAVKHRAATATRD